MNRMDYISIIIAGIALVISTFNILYCFRYLEKSKKYNMYNIGYPTEYTYPSTELPYPDLEIGEKALTSNTNETLINRGMGGNILIDNSKLKKKGI